MAAKLVTNGTGISTRNVQMEHEIPFTTFQPGIATSQPHKFLRNGATILGRKAAKRAAKSREVDFSPSRGFPFAFPIKHGELHDWPFGVF